MNAGERLDVHLVRLGYAASRRAAQMLIEQGLVRVNGRRVRKGGLVCGGDIVEVAPQVEAVGIVANPDLPLDVLFEDASLIVVNKPAPMPCHPLRVGERDTVMNAVVARFPKPSRTATPKRTPTPRKTPKPTPKRTVKKTPTPTRTPKH